MYQYFTLSEFSSYLKISKITLPSCWNLSLPFTSLSLTKKHVSFYTYVIDNVIFWLCTRYSSQNFFSFLEHYSILCPLKQSIQRKSYYVHIMQFRNSIRTTLIRILHIIKYPFLLSISFFSNDDDARKLLLYDGIVTCMHKNKFLQNLILYGISYWVT